MKAFIYTALNTESACANLKGHITTSFTEINRKLPKIATVSHRYTACTGVVSGIEYWPDAGVTVAVVECSAAVTSHNQMMELGLEYPYDFRPHITLSYGTDETEKYKGLVGETFWLGQSYVGTVVKEES